MSKVTQGQWQDGGNKPRSPNTWSSVSPTEPHYLSRLPLFHSKRQMFMICPPRPQPVDQLRLVPASNKLLSLPSRPSPPHPHLCAHHSCTHTEQEWLCPLATPTYRIWQRTVKMKGRRGPIWGSQPPEGRGSETGVGGGVTASPPFPKCSKGGSKEPQEEHLASSPS